MSQPPHYNQSYSIQPRPSSYQQPPNHYPQHGIAPGVGQGALQSQGAFNSGNQPLYGRPPNSQGGFARGGFYNREGSEQQYIPKIEERATTVFVNGIIESIDNEFMENLLGLCGKVNSFKRMKGTKGVLQAFGFCEYESPESAEKALRLLQYLPLGDKRLMLKADQKSAAYIESYIKVKKMSQAAEGTENSTSDKELIVLIGEMAEGKTKELAELVNSNITEGLQSIREGTLRVQEVTREEGASVENQGKSVNMEGENCDTKNNAEAEIEEWNQRVLSKLMKRKERDQKANEVAFKEREGKFLKREEARLKRLEQFLKKEKTRAQDRKDASVDMAEFLSTYDDDKDDAKYYNEDRMDILWRERRKELNMDEKSRKEEMRRLEAAKAAEDAKRREEMEVLKAKKEEEEAARTARTREDNAPSGPQEHNGVINDCGEETVGEMSKATRVRRLIETIPVEKDPLFAYKIDYDAIHNKVVKEKMENWVTKKIVEFLGEEEPDLIEFICEHIQNKTSADDIVNEITEVMADEAEIFVQKLWRFLIFETEAFKQGL